MTSATQKGQKSRWPGDVDEVYPDVFNIKAMPAPSQLKKPGQLPEKMIRQFFDDGFVVVNSFFKPEELNACREDIEKLVDEVANDLLRGGKIKNVYKECDLFERLTKLEQAFPGAGVLLHKKGKLPESFKKLWTNPRLLNVVEQLIGPDIMGHPVWNLRCKTPQNEESTVPWHQDAAYLDNRAYEVMQVTAWIPLLDANKKNGCMEVTSRGHQKGKIARHTCCWGNTWYIMLDEKDMTETLGIDMKKDVKLCEVPYGGMLLLNNVIPHRSLNNTSNEIRWSLDLRWQTPDKNPGTYDLNDGVLMRTKDQPNMTIDWSNLEKKNRAKVFQDAVNKEVPVEVDEFDTTIQGPWMKKWEMVHTNRHTASFVQDPKTWHKN